MNGKKFGPWKMFFFSKCKNGLELLQKPVGRNVEIQKGKSESPGFAEASQLEIGDHGDILHHFVIRDFSKTPMDKFFQTSSRHTTPFPNYQEGSEGLY